MSIRDKIMTLFGGVDNEDEVEIEEEKTPIRKIPTRNIEEEEKTKKIVRFSNLKKVEGNREKMPNNYVSIIRPKVFEDAYGIADAVKDERVVTFSLEFLDVATGQRVIDFIYGATYAMEAQLVRVTEKVLTCIPHGTGVDDFDEIFKPEKENNQGNQNGYL